MYHARPLLCVVGGKATLFQRECQHSVSAAVCCCRAEPVAFRALVAAASQGERQLKDTLVAMLLTPRDLSARQHASGQAAASSVPGQSQTHQQLDMRRGSVVAEADDEAVYDSFQDPTFLESVEDVEDED